ncbi:hypothetical protein PGH07_02090 [Sulfurovum sp. zt1-1]|uniref:Uncharacterized protein n=1 Tax=Sulfurovum zhangzhouensis TaxID=3019067 RepID=A0ABT7QVU8_9BACT|nr:hypothetical protein [Sulfurovum zhangzhouensis]MDM5270965.1 hypothetical protein [Sulfurovum zhangzhouensis]
MLTLIPQWFIRYKFFNSLLLGLSVGAIFSIYTPLEPSVYSLGGVALAVGMLLIARLYIHILNAQWFFRISLLVEIVLLLIMCYFLLDPYTYQTALIVYVGYQMTFVFGNYLVRVETLLLGEDILLTRLDTAKQMGYLMGMAGAYLFYRLMDHYGIVENQPQVYYLHFVLIAVEVIVIFLIINSFKRS